MKERISLIFIEYGEIDVLDGAFVVIDKGGVRTHIPIGSVAGIMLEPGTRVSHRAAALAARVGTLLIWVGEAGVRLYASGQPGGARSDRLLYQAKLALDDQAWLKVVRKIADIVKFDTVVPVAFKIAAEEPRQAEREVRLACRDTFRSTHLLGKIIPMIEEVLSAGGLEPPKESVPPAIKQDEGLGDAGHRH